MQEKMQLEQWFDRTFAKLERDKDQPAGGLENAKEQLLEIYASFLFQKSKAMTRWSSRPIPDEDLPPLPDGFPFRKQRDIFQETEEWMEANLEFGTQRAIEDREEARYCSVVQRELNAASACIQRFSDQLPQSDEEWEEFRRCGSNVLRLASELEALGCH